MGVSNLLNSRIPVVTGCQIHNTSQQQLNSTLLGIQGLQHSDPTCQHSAFDTHTHTTVLRLCVFCPGQPGWAGTRRNIHPLLIVVINHPYLLSPSTMIHGILPIQPTCFTVFFHNLSPSFLWSTSWPGTLHFILHTFLRHSTLQSKFHSAFDLGLLAFWPLPNRSTNGELRTAYNIT